MVKVKDSPGREAAWSDMRLMASRMAAPSLRLLRHFIPLIFLFFGVLKEAEASVSQSGKSGLTVLDVQTGWHAGGMPSMVQSG